MRIHPASAVLFLASLVLGNAGSSPADSGKPPRVLELSLNAAIAGAIANSPEIEVLRLNPERAREEVNEERGRFDPVVTAQAFKQRRVEPSGSSILGTQVTTEAVGGSIGVEQELPIGTRLGLNWDSSRDRDNSLIASLDPAYNSEAVFTVEQPLLQGAWSGRPWMFVRIRQALYKASLDEYEINLADQLREIIRRYWEQQLAHLEVVTAEKSVERAKKFKDEIEGRVSVGVLSPLAGSDANVQVALRNEDLIRARTALVIAKNRLRQAIGLDLSLDAGVEVRLTDEPDFIETKLDAQDSIERALERRPEILAQRARVRSADLSSRVAENELLPEINIVGSAGLQGLSGDPKAAFGGEIDRTFEGDYSDALDETGSGDYYSYRAGVVIRQPLGDIASRARANRARIELAQARARLSALTQEVIVDVKNSMGNLESGKGRITAAREAKTFADESVRNGEERFGVGLITIREVLDAQEDLAEAESTLARALVDYRIALDDVYRSRGELLAKYGISVVRSK